MTDMDTKFFEQIRLVELTHPLTPLVPTWNGSCGFCLEIKQDYDRLFRVQQIKMHAGVGTHMDAPSHRFRGGGSIGDIPLEQLVVKACVIDVSKKAHSEYEVSMQDIKEYESDYGIIAPNSLVIVNTGWSRFWQDPPSYRNTDAKGQMHFPAISPNVAHYLLQKNIAGLATDTLSPDCLHGDFPVHQILLGNGKYIIENVANASHMPPSGGYCIALPLRAMDAAECPIRLVGLLVS